MIRYAGGVSLLVVGLSFAGMLARAEDTIGVEYVERWGVFELTMRGPQEGNPYLDVDFAATFTTGDKEVKVNGFYDGQGRYKVRYSPAVLGPWTYSTTSNRRELEARRGSFICLAPAVKNHGPVQVKNKFYLNYADGSRYYAVGTTAYQWTSVDKAIQQKTLDTLASAPFNKIRMCFFPKSYKYGNDTEPWAYPFARHGNENDYSRPNFEFFQNFDQRVRQLCDMGIQADVILFHSYDRWGYAKMGQQNDDRYLRYLIARLSAYRNVWWSMANEYDLMIHNQEKTLADFDRFLDICQQEDPHQRLRGIHNWYGTEDHFYDHSREAVTHASLQTSRFFDADKWRKKYGKPLLFDEMRYEGDVESGWGNMSSEEMASYFWRAGLSGGYGTHGDTYDNRAGDSETRWWGKGGTLVGTSPPRIAFFRAIMEQAPIVDMTAQTQFVGDRQDTANNVHMLAQAGRYYLVYVAQADQEIRLDLPDPGPYSVEVIDTWNMKIQKQPDVVAGEFVLRTTEPFTAIRLISMSR